MKLLTNRAQIFADVRTYWSPEAVRRQPDMIWKESQRKQAVSSI